MRPKIIILLAVFARRASRIRNIGIAVRNHLYVKTLALRANTLAGNSGPRLLTYIMQVSVMCHGIVFALRRSGWRRISRVISSVEYITGHASQRYVAHDYVPRRAVRGARLMVGVAHIKRGHARINVFMK